MPKSNAQRQKDFRQRTRLNRIQIIVEIDEFVFAAALERSGRIPGDATADLDLVRIEAARILAEFTANVMTKKIL